MRDVKMTELESAGWRVGDAAEFIGLTAEEAAFVELRLDVALYLRELRRSSGWTQSAVAERLGSSQSRVAKMEAADKTVSTDLLLKCLFRLGASPRAVASAQVPLAEVPRGVAGVPKQLRDGHRLRIEPVGHGACLVEGVIGKMPVNRVPRRVVRRQKRTAARRTHGGGDVELLEPRPLAGQPVQVRRLDVRMPGKLRVRPALIVREDEEHVGPLGVRGVEAGTNR